ncbi:hypothetical protein CFP65_4566 [Kitasatospora sp. MMS16-BH015]|uniref:hypothetical protein n=1 Tax=Kitasatospora sp. MMS16-BH015 TaxID=2018025 RepID=UPI000CA24176|nr:hypothetical protein [Kitasatospora sp. MMS16-BH015]AUG79307.1 hypothetical protein CFP65_4566 [Kitasatospora sp. MMS16-BH015]
MLVIDIDVPDLVTRAGQALVVEVARSGWALVREQIGAFLRRNRQADDAQRQLADLDSVVEQNGTDTEQAREALRTQCYWQLGAYLSRHQHMAAELEELLATWGAAEPGGQGMNANGNTASVVIQAGGNVNTGKGSITASGRPRR